MYGILISLGILIASLKAESIAKNEDKDINVLWGGFVWLITMGLIGARLYHVIDYWSYYSENPIKILYVWSGGLGIFGAIITGAITVIIYTHVKKVDMKPWLDLAGIVMPLGQAIGRWGNFFNKELFGPPTKLPWGIYIPQEKRPQNYLTESFFHPLFLYESLSNLILYLVLIHIYNRSRNLFGSGFFCAAYLLGYSIIRFSIEFLKIEAWTINGWNVAQLICLILSCASIPILLSVVKFSRGNKLGEKS